jgi:hypothetical protein
MEVKVSLDSSVNEWGDTIEQVLKEEIRNAIKSLAKQCVQVHKKDMEAQIQKIFKGALSKDALNQTCKKVVEELLR